MRITTTTLASFHFLRLSRALVLWRWHDGVTGTLCFVRGFLRLICTLVIWRRRDDVNGTLCLANGRLAYLNLRLINCD